MGNTRAALLEAKRRLTESPFDVYHTFDHHLFVWQNILEITFAENLQVDLGTLEVATFWHDVFKGKEQQEEAELLKTSLRPTGLDLETIQQITTIIQDHPFGKTQYSVEAKLLYDADKIEYVSILRWKAGFDAYDAGEITIEERDAHFPNLNLRLPELKQSLNFQTSKVMFDTKLELFRKYMSSLQRYKDGKFL